MLLVRGVGELNRLVSEVLSDARSWAVVGLTARRGEDRPAISPGAVRVIVGPRVPIYLICWRVTVCLQGMLPDGLHVFGGAGRVWWPLPRPGRDPGSHPLVYDASGEYGEAALADLARVYESSRLPSRQAEELLRRQRDAAEARAGGLADRVSGLTRERDELLGGAVQADREAAGAGDDALVSLEGGEKGSLLVSGGDVERRLHLLICREWYDSLSGRADRERYPLGGYVLAGGLIADLRRRRVEVPLERVAWVLAMIASGRARDISGLGVHPLVKGAGVQVTRSVDGARGWRCALRHVSGGPRLHYWVHPGGLVEFEAIGHHDKLPLPLG